MFFERRKNIDIDIFEKENIDIDVFEKNIDIDVFYDVLQNTKDRANNASKSGPINRTTGLLGSDENQILPPLLVCIKFGQLSLMD